MLLVLITGTLFLVWLADQNTTYGIAGPMPIVLMSLVKSMFNSHFAKLNLNPILLVIIICSLALILFILLFIERSEYRLEYNDIMNISSKDTPTYLSWKLNPAGSITIMMSLSIFILENNIVNLIGRLAVDKDFEGIYPGKHTKRFLSQKARRVCWSGSIIVAIVLAIPLYCSLLVPHLFEEIYFSIQLIVFVYIGINIAETLRAYLYLDGYKQILDKYW